jgi:hypothetical protein|tara:strand:+ start:970 stop:1497 length:528 start_codon:yes stop_codon:yes gene_type:complete
MDDKQYFLEALKRLGVICLLLKDKFGAGLLTGSLFMDSRISLLSKLLSMVSTNWEELNLDRFLPEDLDANELIGYITELRAEYVNKETYIHMSYKNVKKNDSILFYELPEILNYERVNKEKTRVYYNLIPDRIIYVLQRIKIPKIFVTKCYLYTTTDDWATIDTLLQRSYETYGD